MSFCIRSITTSGKYVVAQSCAARRLSSRQLTKPVTSSFLNEFLGSNVPLTTSQDIRDEYKSTYIFKEAINSTCTDNPLQSANFLLDNCENLSTHQNEDECFSQEISPVSNVTSVDYQPSYSYDLKSYERPISVTYQENGLNSLTYLSDRFNISIIDPDPVTKNGTKVTFSSLTNSTAALNHRNINASSSTENDADKKPSKDDLEHVFNTLSVDLPKFFVKTVDYRIYHPEIEFVDNIHGITYKGIYNYVRRSAYTRAAGHFKFAYVKLDVLKMTMHTHDNTIRVRWRISGVSQWKVFVMFWKFKFWKIKEAIKDAETWYDGFSTFYVGEDGLIYKHVADKMMPDQEIEEIKPKTMPTKLAGQLTFSSLN